MADARLGWVLPNGQGEPIARKTRTTDATRGAGPDDVSAAALIPLARIVRATPCASAILGHSRRPDPCGPLFPGYPVPMCGICGLFCRGGVPEAEQLTAMIRTLAHRGPDGEGSHIEGPAALGHRRLSIIDLSEAAREPMTNEDRTLWLIFNGEIYNFRELRTDLDARRHFPTHG